MRSLAARFWSDDRGAIIAAEYLFVVTILIIGTMVGLASVREAINTELAEVANALLALSQGYTIQGSTTPNATIEGSTAIDTPGLVPEIMAVPNAIPSVIDQIPGN
jgi:Flp pilus assembly pilin Flp